MLCTLGCASAAADGQPHFGRVVCVYVASCTVPACWCFIKHPGIENLAPLHHHQPQLPARRPSELCRVSKRQKKVNRIYGGCLSHKVVRERIIRAFLVEEQKIVKKVWCCCVPAMDRWMLLCFHSCILRCAGAQAAKGQEVNAAFTLRFCVTCPLSMSCNRNAAARVAIVANGSHRRQR